MSKKPKPSSGSLKSLTQLKGAAYNPRTITDEALEGLTHSLAGFGDISGIVWNERTGTLVAGHQRLRALREKYGKDLKLVAGALVAGLHRFPVRVVDWDEATEKAANVTANNPHIAGEFDEGLQAVLDEVNASLPDLMASLNLDDLITTVESDAGEIEEDEVPEPPVKPVTKPGDLWLLGGHRVLCGDSTKREDVERVVHGAKLSLMVTSPPYNIGVEKMKGSGMFEGDAWTAKVRSLAYNDTMPEADYQQSQKELLRVWHDILSDGASVFYNHQNRSRKKVVISPLVWLPGPFRLRQEIVWKRTGGLGLNNRSFLQCDQRIYWLYKGADFFFDDSTEIKAWSTVWELKIDADSEHSVPYPVELPSRCIRACSRSGDSVADPYLGSGTTLIACEQLGRKCMGIEIEPRYVDVIVKRWETLTGEKAKRSKA